MMWNLQSYPTTVLNEILWQFRGQTYSDPSCIFSGSQDSLTPRIYAPDAVAGYNLRQKYSKYNYLQILTCYPEYKTYAIQVMLHTALQWWATD